MKKHIVREVGAEHADLQYYFEDDGLSEKSGDWNNTLFIVQKGDYGRLNGFNLDEYKRVKATIDSLIEGFSDVEDGLLHYDGEKLTYKGVMQENGLKYSPTTRHKLKEWAKGADPDDLETMAEYLRIVTGEYWKVTSARGYCQGDYCEVLCSAERYANARAYGEVWLGAAKEFCVIDLDENGEEESSCYGYIVADCQAWKDEQYKRLVCEWACIDPQETELQMIEECHTRTEYTYRTA